MHVYEHWNTLKFLSMTETISQNADQLAFCHDNCKKVTILNNFHKSIQFIGFFLFCQLN